MEMTLSKIAEKIGGEVIGDGEKIISNVAPFEDAKKDDITYAGIPRFLKKVDETDAGAVIVPPEVETASTNLIRVENPRLAFARTLSIFYPPQMPSPGIHPKAVIGENFVNGKDLFVGPNVVIGNNVTIGECVCIHPCTAIGDHVILGDDVTIYPNVTIRERCRIGNRVTINAGTVIGSDGFGFEPEGETNVKMPQTGIVQIDDDVEIGALNTIDRSSFGKTWLKKGVKTDNQVHIAHNVTIGENTVMAAQCGISGSVTIGKYVKMGGKTGVADHVTIGDNVTIGARGNVYQDVESGQVVFGEQMEPRLWARVNRTLPRLPDMRKKISELEKKLSQILEKRNG